MKGFFIIRDFFLNSHYDCPHRSNASLASFEDSNTENEPEAGRPRVASVSRKSRVTRASKSVLADMDGEEEKKNR